MEPAGTPEGVNVRVPASQHGTPSEEPPVVPGSNSVPSSWEPVGQSAAAEPNQKADDKEQEKSEDSGKEGKRRKKKAKKSKHRGRKEKDSHEQATRSWRTTLAWR